MVITDGKKWHYLAVKSVSALFRRITSKNVFTHFIKKYVKIMIIAM